MLIYCTGDSFTDGTGLSDSRLFEEYPGDIIAGESNIPWSKKRSEIFSSNILLFEKSRQENLKLAWPAKIAELTNYEVINGAVSGASIVSISMGLMHDIEKLVAQGKTPNKVFIGLTSCERVPIINTHPIENFMPSAITNAIPNHASYVPEKYKSYCDQYWMSHTDEEMLTFYMYHCVCMHNYVYAKTGTYPVFLNTSRGIINWHLWVKNSSIFLLKEYWKILNADRILEQHSLEGFNSPKNTVLADGHYKESAHLGFAQHLVKEYLDD